MSDEIEKKLDQLLAEMISFGTEVSSFRHGLASFRARQPEINVELVKSFMGMLRRCGDGGPNATLTITREFADDLHGHLAKLGVPVDGDAP